MLNFLKSFDVIQGDQFSAKFRESVRVCSINFAKENLDDPKLPLELCDVFTLCLLAAVEDISNSGLPTNLLERGTEIAGHFFKAFHHEEWRKAGQVVGDTNWLRKKHVLKQSSKGKPIKTKI